MNLKFALPAAGLAAAAAAGGAIHAVFQYAFARDRKNQDPNHINYAPLHPFRQEIEDAVRWFHEQGPDAVTIRSDDGLQLKGYYLEHPDPKGVMVLVHGYRGNWSTDFSCVFPYYYELGFSVLTFCQRAQGESEGDYICFGVRESHDLVRWLEYLNTRIPADLPVILDGISMGASTVMMAAGLELPENVCGIIADSGFTSPWDQFASILHGAHVPVHPVLDVMNLVTKKKLGFGLKEVSTLDAMRKLKLPIVFIHGGDDTYVPTRFSYENYEACASEDKKLIVVPGAVHGMSYLTDRPLCQREIREFLSRCTGKEV